MNSRHLTGHAVDIVPIIGGKISWNFDDLSPAKAMAQSAIVCQYLSKSISLSLSCFLSVAVGLWPHNLLDQAIGC